MQRIIVFIFLLSFIIDGNAQHSSVLDKKVSIDVQQRTIEEVLELISKQTGLSFSYNPKVIDVTKKVSLHVANKPIKTVLTMVLGINVAFKIRGHFIILTLKNNVKPKYKVVSGYISNNSGDAISSVSVYNKQQQLAALSNQLGYFKLEYPINSSVTSLKIAKVGYYDTIIVIPPNHHVDVVLKEIVQARNHLNDTENDSSFSFVIDKHRPDTLSSSEAIATDSLVSINEKIRNLFLNEKSISTYKNITDTFFKQFQFAVVPMLSTNELLTANTINDFSLSVLAGYNKGVNIAAVAGLANIINGKASYSATAGLFNLITDTAKGCMVAGLSNIHSGYVNAVQVAGISNVNTSDAKAIQIGGVFNINTGKMDGIQIGGVFNQANADTITMQLAGITNIASGHIEGVQASGVLNILNGSITGAQLSGVVNIANEVNGVQLGLVNISNQINGIPIGLLSWSTKGYHKLEMGYDETMINQLAFRTGNHALHNIFIAGVDLTNRINGLWSFGYGLGSFHHFNNRWLNGIEVSSQYLTSNLSENGLFLHAINYQVEYKIGPAFSIAIGPSVRAIFNYSSTDEIQKAITPYSIYSHQQQSYQMTLWAGGKISLKMF